MGTGCDELILQLRLLRQVASPLHPASQVRRGAGAGAQLHHLMPALAITRDLEFGRLVKLDGWWICRPDPLLGRNDGLAQRQTPNPPKGRCWRRPAPGPALVGQVRIKAPDQVQRSSLFP